MEGSGSRGLAGLLPLSAGTKGCCLGYPDRTVAQIPPHTPRATAPHPGASFIPPQAQSRGLRISIHSLDPARGAAL